MKKFFENFKKNNGQKGSMLAETMISVAILGVSIAATTQQSSNINDLMSQEKALINYTRVSSEINTFASSFNLLKRSFNLANNNSINRCINGAANSAKDCQSISFGSAGIGVGIFDPINNVLVAGASASNPVFYDSNGEICQPSAANPCTFKSYASVRPICFNNESNCSVAFAFVVKYTVEPVFNDKFWLSAARMPIPIEAEVITDTNLLPPLAFMTQIQCVGSRQVLKGVSFQMEPICATFPDPIKGPTGDDGQSIQGSQGPEGNTASDPGGPYPHG